MKNISKRILLIGLVGLMLASLLACDQIGQGNIAGEDPEGQNTPVSTNPYDNLKGSVWKKVGASGAMIGDYIASNEIRDQGIPLEFFTEEGLIYKAEDGRYFVNGENQPDNMYNPFHYRAYVDPNSPENDIYLLIQYASKHLGQNENNPDIYLATYMLQYELDDENYETFLKLDGDRLIKDFIQEMDRQFEERVIFKSVVTQDLVNNGSHVKNEHWTRNGFPNIFVADVDYNNATITYGATSKEGIRYFNLKMRETNGWIRAQQEDGLTEEECDSSINMSIMNTPVGKCLVKFQVNGRGCAVTSEEAKQLYNTTDRIQELEEININAQEKTLH